MISAWDCLHSATLELVRPTPIKQHIISAYRQCLSKIPEEQLPLEIRDGYARMLASLRGVAPLPGEDVVTASVRRCRGVEADCVRDAGSCRCSRSCAVRSCAGSASADLVVLAFAGV